MQEIIKTIYEAQIADWKKKHLQYKMEENPDWAAKRVKVILGEAERLGVEMTQLSPKEVEAKWKGLPLIGRFVYEKKGNPYKESKRSRSRVALRLWVKSHTGEGEISFLQYDGKNISENYGRNYLVGGEVLEIVFGKKRIMIYDRLLSATLNCVGKIK